MGRKYVYVFCEQGLKSRMIKTLDPEDTFLQKWNKIFLVSCLVAVCLDPLLFYIPIVDSERLCLTIDYKLAITVFVLRLFIDVFYAIRIFLKFHTGFVSPSTRVYRGGEVVKDSKAITERYLRSSFIMDILSILPLPQAIIVIVMLGARSEVQTRPLTILITTQNFVRLLRVFPLCIKVIKTTGVITERPWNGAAYNFCLYLLASHVIGSFWYLSSVERVNKCWRAACGYNHCNVDALYCGRNYRGSNSFLVASCSPLQPSESVFDYGVYRNALSIQLYRDLFRRFFYCFVWGLRNLSSLGQNLETSNEIGENLFVVIISITGLILFSVLASNIQRLLQSLTVSVDEMRLKRVNREKYMSLIPLPLSLKSRVRQHDQYKWLKNKGIDEESVISDLPEELRMDIKRYQCMELLLRVPMFDKMDQRLIDALCCYLKRVFYTKGTTIVREGYPVYKMLFITKGRIMDGAIMLKPGDFCSDELLMWAIDPNTPRFPISTTTLLAVTDLEAFSLMPDDLKRVVSEFRFLQSEQFELNFRLNSEKWRSWGACIIQAAWRRYRQRKIQRPLQIVCLIK